MPLLGKCTGCGRRWYWTGDDINEVPACRGGGDGCGKKPSPEDVRLMDKILREQGFAMRQARRDGGRAPTLDWAFQAR